MPVEQVTSGTFRDQVLEKGQPVVVDFYADWCGPCHQVSPAVEELSRRWHGRVHFTKVDIDRNPDVAEAYRIQSIPSILLFVDGEPQAWVTGAKPGYLIEKQLGLAKRTGFNPDKAARAARKAAKEGGAKRRGLARLFGR